MNAPNWLDRPGAQRDGEELDNDRLAEYLPTVLPDFGSGEVRVEQFAKGYSNLTYLVSVGDRSVVLRRPPFGVKIKTAHDMGREYRILSHLHPVWAKVPEPLVFCEDEDVLGVPFYLMERVEGIILRKEMPEAMTPAPELTARITATLVGSLAELHAVDYEAAGLGELGRPEGYVRRQVEGWAKRYVRSQTDDVREMDLLGNWLLDSMPPESGAALIHNDFKHDNVVLDGDDWSRLIAVLDWEMATLGDPLMDFGVLLAYWTQPEDPPELIEARLSPTLLPGTPSRADVVELYARASGNDVQNVVFYYAFGLYKVAVIVQQLYARYVAGHTTDPRFANLMDGVRALSQVAWQSVQKGRIDRLF
ncbi:MAG: phosphotransferase family protein [Gemmatimonadetes bacterium]|jgi:aminoglycoside phosphotransferase (APT) family kinase protein|nr:phosphotransferase family protein [Gemmatimonadota bacterium]|tara:strand:+ start:6000 stop:7088 length:1089 start_codon:yes stop_codon:yes gene_type:complete